VTDLVDGLLKLMASRDEFTGPVNLGNPEEFTMLECADFAAHRSTQKLWDNFGDQTIKAIAMGVRILAVIWASAWKQGKGESKVPAAALKAIPKAKLKSLYEDRDKFVPSVRLDEIAAILTANGNV
jgi:hypothetical protein